MAGLPYKIITKGVRLPKRKTKEAARFDLSAVKNVQIGPGESTIVGTGIAIKIPKGHYRQIKP